MLKSNLRKHWVFCNEELNFFIKNRMNICN